MLPAVVVFAFRTFQRDLSTFTSFIDFFFFFNLSFKLYFSHSNSHMTLGSPVLGPVGSRQRVILWIFNRIKLFSSTLPTVYLFYVILRTHRHKNFKSLLPYVVFLKRSLCATLHEDAFVQAIVFRQRVSFFFLWKSV